MSRRHLPVMVSMRCDAGCGECCGPVPVTEAEVAKVRRHVAKYKIKARNNGEGACPFYAGRCMVYEARPFLCRVFGHTPNLRCPRGYNTNELRDEVVRGYLIHLGPATTTLIDEFRPVGELRE